MQPTLCVQATQSVQRGSAAPPYGGVVVPPGTTILKDRDHFVIDPWESRQGGTGVPTRRSALWAISHRLEGT
ncbi:hypothetical protein GCM10009841_06790 [Microlunatus panaciterrae]